MRPLPKPALPVRRIVEMAVTWPVCHCCAPKPAPAPAPAPAPVPPPPAPAPIPMDEFWINGPVPYLGDGVTDPKPYDAFTGEATTGVNPYYTDVAILRRLVARVGKSIIQDVINTDSTMPQTSWVQTDGTQGSPTLYREDMSQGRWLVKPPGQTYLGGYGGIFTITVAGPLVLVITYTTNQGSYPAISWEYQWTP